MIRMVRNVAATLAIASLAGAQPALAVRSSDSLPVAGAKVAAPEGQRVGSRVGEVEGLNGDARFWVPAITITATIAILLALLYGKHNGNPPPHVSPG